MNDRDTKREFQQSLDLIDAELEKYVPQLLAGLFELGSMPGYIEELIQKNINTRFTTITDLGCGKGAVLIRLAQKFDFKGQGIDIVPEFIEEARQLSKKLNLSERLSFIAGDFIKIIPTIKEQDILIYGYDSEILGDIRTTLNTLSPSVTANGIIILECMYAANNAHRTTGIPTEPEMLQQINSTGLKIIDRITWDINKLKEVNKLNNTVIKKNAAQLAALHPDKEPLFNRYFENQLQECLEIENDFTCETILLKK